MTSAYPIALDELTDKVRDQATELGRWPSRNEVMRTHRVGGPKASDALIRLRASGFDPRTTPGQARLHTVPTTDENTADTTDDHDTVDAPQVTTVPDPDTVVTTAADPTGSDIDAAPAAADPAPVEVVPTVAPTSASDPAPAASLRRLRVWLVVLALGAFTSIWGGWVGLGELTGFGPIRLLPGIADGWVINSAITLPLGVEAYAALALRVWLADAAVPARAREFARTSAVSALALGAAGQVAYHLMTAAAVTVAPWPITAAVACLPVVVLGCGAALIHLTHQRDTHDEDVTR